MFLSFIYKLSLIAAGFYIVILTRFVVHYFSVRRTFRHVPGPPRSSLLWGEEWELYHGRPGARYVEWHKNFGKLVAFTGAFGHQIISITDPRAISFILGDGAYHFPKPHGVRAWFKATLGEGILWVEGKKEHELQRRTLAPALNQQSVRELVAVLFETSARLANQWNKVIDQNHGQETEIEVTNWAGRFALDTIGRAAFSYDFECLAGEPHELATALDGLTNSENSLASFYMRALFWLFPSILSIGKKGEMIRETKSQLGAIASKMWKDARLVGDTNDRTLLATMLRCEQVSGSKMDEEEVVSQMRTVISAGYETVSAIVAWIFYEIARHPDIQAELREEICAIPDLSFEHFNNELPFLDAVLKETLRLHPAVLENHHEASETIMVPLAEPIVETGEMQLVVPKGTLISIPVNVLQEDPEFWGLDADEFRPSRWLEKKKTGLVKGQELLAFSMGPRSCLGKTFAMAEIKRFSFRCQHEIEPFQSFVIRPRIKGETGSSLPLLVKKL
ncbi:unnamed protein product [Cyclocybe aegerita]|uniref:Cytochrome P450 n=1 Tax=Cyclocybe aegerita TaxID=1973307 RepID=A0A8S0WL02_CYCAE|nr:unnamed protein product [Cyclocybe aegerita]